jgi:hypothetical protein
MAIQEFNKEKYLTIAKAQGVAAALTQLQKDTIQWEFDAFEGEKGYDPKQWAALVRVREFSRELWEMDLRS